MTDNKLSHEMQRSANYEAVKGNVKSRLPVEILSEASVPARYQAERIGRGRAQHARASSRRGSADRTGSRTRSSGGENFPGGGLHLLLDLRATNHQAVA